MCSSRDDTVIKYMWLIIQNVITFLPHAYVIPAGSVRSHLALWYSDNGMMDQQRTNFGISAHLYKIWAMRRKLDYAVCD